MAYRRRFLSSSCASSLARNVLPTARAIEASIGLIHSSAGSMAIDGMHVASTVDLTVLAETGSSALGRRDSRRHPSAQ